MPQVSGLRAHIVSGTSRLTYRYRLRELPSPPLLYPGLDRPFPSLVPEIYDVDSKCFRSTIMLRF
jgi:hypothetical protein